jgi:hypothetical protein
MPDQDPTKTQRAATDRTADAARAATEAGAQATRQGAEKLQDQMNSMLGTAGRASQEAARLTSENMELMKRLAETMAAGAKEASSEIVEWTRRASERQSEATRPDHASAQPGRGARLPKSLHQREPAGLARFQCQGLPSLGREG